MIESLIRFLNRPVIIKRAHPSRRMRVALWWLLAPVWLLLQVADLATTWALVGVRHPHHPYYEGDPLAAWALAHGGVGALAVQKALAAARFRWFPRATLALLAGFSALVAVAVVNNSVGC